jgi:Sigma 54 modulation/S30EA ribosomal protein C terminus
MSVTQMAPVQVQIIGIVPEGMAELAEKTVGSLLRHVGEPVLFARVMLMMAADPAVARPAIARATVSVNGRLVRAQTADATMRDAVHHLRDRLRIRLEAAWSPPRRASHVRPAGRASAAGGPQSGAVQQKPERPVIHRHSVAARPKSVEDALAELDLLGYDFHLFTELSTGQDSVVYRSGDGYRLTWARLATQATLPAGVTASDHAAPALSAGAAITRLEALGQQFAFYVDSQTGRGNVLYRRDDGRYGLVTLVET